MCVVPGTWEQQPINRVDRALVVPPAFNIATVVGKAFAITVKGPVSLAPGIILTVVRPSSLREGIRYYASPCTGCGCDPMEGVFVAM